LLSVAFKNLVGTRRAAWRTVSAIQDKEEYKGAKNVELIKWYRIKIETELNEIANECIDLLDKILIPNSTVADAKVFYMKMKGDYYRYLCEFLSGEK
jgi:14-3-3 protein epsilon